MSRIMSSQFRSVRAYHSQRVGGKKAANGTRRVKAPKARSEQQRHRVHRFSGQVVSFGQKTGLRERFFRPARRELVERQNSTLHSLMKINWAAQVSDEAQEKFGRPTAAMARMIERQRSHETEVHVFSKITEEQLRGVSIHTPEGLANLYHALEANGELGAKPTVAMELGAQLAQPAPLPVPSVPKIADLRIIPILPVWQHDPFEATLKGQALAQPEAAPVAAPAPAPVKETARKEGFFGKVGAFFSRCVDTVAQTLNGNSKKLDPRPAY